MPKSRPTSVASTGGITFDVLASVKCSSSPNGATCACKGGFSNNCLDSKRRKRCLVIVSPSDQNNFDWRSTLFRENTTRTSYLLCYRFHRPSLERDIGAPPTEVIYTTSTCRQCFWFSNTSHPWYRVGMWELHARERDLCYTCWPPTVPSPKKWFWLWQSRHVATNS